MIRRFLVLALFLCLSMAGCRKPHHSAVEMNIDDFPGADLATKIQVADAVYRNREVVFVIHNPEAINHTISLAPNQHLSIK